MLKYWVWLSLALLPSGKACDELISEFGSAEKIYSLSKEDYKFVSGITKGELNNLCNKNLDRAESIIKYCEKNNINIMCMEDECYPAQLKTIFSPPPVLYWAGELPDFNTTPMITIVGTRHSTKDGEKIAYEFSAKLSEVGCVIVSGLATGIDSAAAKGCLAGGSKSIAILGSGVDVLYPASNSKLRNEIIANGAVISEFAPGTPGLPHNFPIRNRIMAGLGLGVLVVEAPKRSGALITSRLALEMGKDVFVVPGSICDVHFEGSNAMIAEGCCIPVVSPEQIARNLPVHFEIKETVQEKIDVDLSPVEAEIVKHIKYHGRLHIDKLKEFTEIPETQLLTAVMMLEINGIVINEGADIYAVYNR